MELRVQPGKMETRSWVGLLLTVLALTLWAGLDPKGYRFRNEVDWLPGRPGLHFGRYAIACTPPFLTATEAESLNASGWTLELAVELTDRPRDGFKILAAFHNGNDSSQLIIGQWHSYLIAMNGDDYSHQRRTPRVTANTTGSAASERWLTLTSGPHGTSVYLDGRLAGSAPTLRLRLPASPTPARLVLGNVPDGTQSLNGNLLGLALFGRVLTAVEIERRAAQWRLDHTLPFVGPDGCALRYGLDEGAGRRVADRSGRNIDLEIPTAPPVLQRRAFAFPPFPVELRRGELRDILLNLFGFTPLGFVLLGCLHRTAGRATRSSWLLAVLTGALLSFGIELAQSWIPSRSSSLLDLLLNIAGTGLGGLAFVVAAEGLRRRRSPPHRQEH